MVSIYNPRQIVLVTCREEIEIMGRVRSKENIITVAWHTPLSHEPMLYGIAIGKNRFTRKIIDKAGCFVVNFVGEDLKDVVTKAGSISGEHNDKFTACGLVPAQAVKIDAPRIKEAIGWIECEVIETVDAGDHLFYIGKVIHGEQNSDAGRLFHVNGKEYTTTY